MDELHKVGLDLEKSEAIKWLLGGLAAATAARAGTGLYRQFTGDVGPVTEQSDIVDKRVRMPIYMSPEQYEAYEQSRLSEDGTPKVADALDMPAKVLLGLLGAGVGWKGTSALIKHFRKDRIDDQLAKARNELNQLVLTPADQQDSEYEYEIPEQSKAAVDRLGEILDEAYKAATEVDLAEFHAEKTAGLGSVLKKLLTSKATKVIGGTTAAGAGIYGLDKGLSHLARSKNKFTNTIDSSSPGSFFNDKILGSLATVASLALLYGGYKGYQNASKASPTRNALAKIRASAQEQEKRRPLTTELYPVIRRKKVQDKETEVVPQATNAFSVQDLTSKYDDVGEGYGKAASYGIEVFAARKEAGALATAMLPARIGFDLARLGVGGARLGIGTARLGLSSAKAGVGTVAALVNYLQHRKSRKQLNAVNDKQDQINTTLQEVQKLLAESKNNAVEAPAVDTQEQAAA